MYKPIIWAESSEDIHAEGTKFRSASTLMDVLLSVGFRREPSRVPTVGRWSYVAGIPVEFHFKGYWESAEGKEQTAVGNADYQHNSGEINNIECLAPACRSFVTGS